MGWSGRTRSGCCGDYCLKLSCSGPNFPSYRIRVATYGPFAASEQAICGDSNQLDDANRFICGFELPTRGEGTISSGAEIVVYLAFLVRFLF